MSGEPTKTEIYSDISGTENITKENFSTDILDLWVIVSKHFIEEDILSFSLSVNSTPVSLDLFSSTIQVVKEQYQYDIESAITVPQYESNTDISLQIEVTPSTVKDKTETSINDILNLNDIDIDWNDIGIYVKINDKNYYPIRFEIDSQHKIHIELTEFMSGKELYIGSKKQFIYHHYTA